MYRLGQNNTTNEIISVLAEQRVYADSKLSDLGHFMTGFGDILSVLVETRFRFFLAKLQSSVFSRL